MDRYVYLLKDGDVPFYVGKGTRALQYSDKYQRPVEHIREAALPTNQQKNRHKCAVINQILARGNSVGVELVADEISEVTAIQQETHLIEKFGRKSDGGILTNMISEQRMMAHELRNKPVFCFSTTGVLIQRYISIKAAFAATGVKSGIISCCCRDIYKTGGGYVWSYHNVFPGYEKAKPWNERAVNCYLPSLKFVSSYPSASEAARNTGIPEGQINKCVRGKGITAGGFMWTKAGKVPTIVLKKSSGKSKRPVDQYTAEGVLIASYESTASAMKHTGIKGITRCTSHRARVAGGYFWAYKGCLPIIRTPSKRGGFYKCPSNSQP